MSLKIRYNAPVVLTLSLLAILILLLSVSLWPRLNYQYFAIGGSVQWSSVADWFRLFSHVLGHAHWSHLASNLTLILLLGPILEARYGSRTMLTIILITALATGLVNVALFNTGLMGASGIVFMLIILASMTDLRAGTLPLTFVLVAVIFLGREVVAIFQDDDVSQMAHLVGGAIGAGAGLLLRR
jgi:membrane associated rhomboid family serine protease